MFSIEITNVDLNEHFFICFLKLLVKIISFNHLTDLKNSLFTDTVRIFLKMKKEEGFPVTTIGSTVGEEHFIEIIIIIINFNLILLL